MKKIAVILIILVLLFIGIAGWTLAMIGRYTVVERDKLLITQNNIWSTELSKVQSTAVADAAAKSTTVADAVARSTAVAKIQTTSTAQQSNLQLANEALMTATEYASSHETEIADIRHLAATQVIKIKDLEAIGNCGIPPSIDYTSNSTVSESLKKWLEDSRAKITDAKWEVIWQGTKTALHSFYTDEALFLFIVYFDEPENYFHESVYDIFGYCWIDP